PGHSDRWLLASRGEVPRDYRGTRERFGIASALGAGPAGVGLVALLERFADHGRFRAHAARRVQPESLHDDVEGVARHVAQASRAEIVPAPEVERMVQRVIGPLGRGPQPDIPIERPGGLRLVA